MMELFKLEKPPKIDSIEQVIKAAGQGDDIISYIADVNGPEYLYWDKVKYKPCPKGIAPEEFWALIKFFRQNSPGRIITPIKDEKGGYFTWQSLPGLDYFLHEIDMMLRGNIESLGWNEWLSNNRFITRGIMEEAIASSQLEGANTTRKVAKKMLIEKRKPANKSEQMILNNYQVMLEIENDLIGKDLTKPELLKLHTALTNKTISENEVGRFRVDSDQIVIGDTKSNIVYHIPPNEAFLQEELDNFLSYANDVPPTGQFVHPVIKAIILHFWLAYLHPFTDGNGRLARAIFYWYLLKNNYWGFSFLPVSRVIRSSPAQYRNAYLYSEQDDNDLTYFIDYHIRKIEQAKKEFESYIKRKDAENKKLAQLVRSDYNLNDRQIQLLRYLYKNPGATTTIALHTNIYNVSRLTASKDLHELEKLKLIKSLKRGREKLFEGTENIRNLFDSD